MLRVLVPSDGSPRSQYGVRHVVGQFLQNPDLEVHLVNVQPPLSNYVSRFVSRRDRIEFHQQQAEAALLPARQPLDSAGVPYTVHTETGDKADCIVRAAQRLDVDRIVMSIGRKRSLLRWVEDSVIYKVLERSPVPVEVVAGDTASNLERVGALAGIGTGLGLVWMAID